MWDNFDWNLIVEHYFMGFFVLYLDFDQMLLFCLIALLAQTSIGENVFAFGCVSLQHHFQSTCQK
jgi:hypothetical protein